MRVVLPLPPKELSPNKRCGWRAKATATKKYRGWAMIAALVVKKADSSWPWKAATTEATFHFKEPRRRDKDNLLASLKAAFDGIADACIVNDDSALTHMPIKIVVGSSDPRVEIVLARDN